MDDQSSLDSISEDHGWDENHMSYSSSVTGPTAHMDNPFDVTVNYHDGSNFDQRSDRIFDEFRSSRGSVGTEQDLGLFLDSRYNGGGGGGRVLRNDFRSPSQILEDNQQQDQKRKSTSVDVTVSNRSSRDVQHDERRKGQSRQTRSLRDRVKQRFSGISSLSTTRAPYKRDDESSEVRVPSTTAQSSVIEAGVKPPRGDRENLVSSPSIDVGKMAAGVPHIATTDSGSLGPKRGEDNKRQTKPLQDESTTRMEIEKEDTAFRTPDTGPEEKLPQEKTSDGSHEPTTVSYMAGTASISLDVLSETRRAADPTHVIYLKEYTRSFEEALSSSEIENMCTMNIWEEKYLRRKFLLYYHRPEDQWTQVTFTVNFGGEHHVNSRLAHFLQNSSRVQISAWIYGILRLTLEKTKFYPTVTAFEIMTGPNGQLLIWVTEETEWVVKEPLSPEMFIPTLSVPQVPESHVKLVNQISPYVYEVCVDSKILVRHDITASAPIIEGLVRLRKYHSPYIARLEGLIIDDASSHIKGILLPLLSKSLGSELNTQTGWKRRLKWARQIGEGFLDAIHCGTYCIAPFNMDEIFIDEKDDAKLLIGLSNYDGSGSSAFKSALSTGIEAYNIRRLGLALERLAFPVSLAEDWLSDEPLWYIEPGGPAWFNKYADRCCYGAFETPYLQTDEFVQDMLDALNGSDVGEPSEGPECDVEDTYSEAEDDVFDTLSVMSIESAITSSSGYGNMAESAAMEFVDLLDGAIDVCALARPRLEAKTLDVDRLRQGIRRLIKLLSKDLSKELSGTKQRDVGGFFMSASRPISMAIISRARLSIGTEIPIPLVAETQKPAQVSVAMQKQVQETQGPGERAIIDISETESEDSEIEVEEQEATVNLTALRGAISASSAFKAFVVHLEDLICPTFESKLRKMSSVGKEKADKIDADGTLREVLSELLYARPLELSFLDADEYTWIDKAKDYAERSAEHPWDWWPLRPKKTTLQSEQVRLTWKCPCGEIRTADIRRGHAKYILKARQETANESTGAGSGKPNNTDDFRNPSGGSSQTDTDHKSRPGDSHFRGSSGTSYIPSPSATFLGSRLATPPGSTRSSRYIPLMISSGALLLNEIESQDLCNENLFSKIRDAYNDAKGIRRWFSTMRFSHCEFFKFEEWSRKRYCERSPGIPPKEDTEYYYVPRPMDREPPISRHEFHDRFYQKVSGEDCHFGVSQETCSDRDAVDRIPQINKLVSVSDSKRQQFYGIVTREKKSGLIMMLYILLCSIPGTIFFFLWVFRWGHDSLQDASILLILSWTLLGLFYAAQFL